MLVFSGAEGAGDAAGVEALWADFLSGQRGASWSRVWVLVALDEWLERTSL